MKKKIVPVFAAIILIVIVAAIGIISGLIKKYSPTDERTDIEAYYAVENEEDLALILQNQLIENKGKIIDGIPYLDIDTVKTYLNDRFYWDAKENIMVYTTPTDIITVQPGTKDYFTSKNKTTESYTILKVDGAVAYLAAEYIQKFTNMEFMYHESPNRLIVTYQWGDIQTTTIKKSDSIRVSGGVKSLVVADVRKGDKVQVLEAMDDWTKVITSDGFIGYIQNKRLGEVKTETIAREFEEPVYTSIKKDYKINLTWHQVTNQEANDNILNDIADTKGVTTLSPTWFSISDNNGNITSLASNSYVNYAHQSNKEVWGLVDNFNPEVSTYEVLSSTSKRENLINQLISAAINYNLDGINVDFENIEVEAGPAYVQFMRELSIKCRKNNLVLSVDVPVPMPYTAHYDRTELGIVSDYVIIMGYDELHDNSEVSGSVASLPFVRAGIEETLQEVEADKVINAIPFYTRLWKEETHDDGSVTVISEDLAMGTGWQRVAEQGVEAFWSDESSQYYAEYELADGFYRIWLEDATSLEEKVKLTKEYNLTGVASWKLGLESDGIWDVILKYVN